MRNLYVRFDANIEVSEEVYLELLNEYSKKYVLKNETDFMPVIRYAGTTITDEQSDGYNTYEDVDIYIKHPLDESIPCTIKPTYTGAAKTYEAKLELVSGDACIPGDEFMYQDIEK